MSVYQLYYITENQNIMFSRIINPQKVRKTFVVEREDTQQAIIIDYQLTFIGQWVNIAPILDFHCPIRGHRISIYDPSVCKFISLARLGSQNGCIPKYLFEPAKGSFILESQSFNSNWEAQEHSNDLHSSRSRERSIGDVIEVVKKWRDLHLHGHPTIRKRLNLQDAAKMVNISKKSLDDYYCQLRLAQLYHFDYPNNLHQKMGVLRAYVKNYRPQKQQSRRRQNDKHPKNLKIVNYYDIATHQLKNVEDLLKEQQYAVLLQRPQIHQSPQDKFELMVKNQADNNGEVYSSFFSEPVAISKQLLTLQHDFFKGFEIDLDEEGDPYYQADRDRRDREEEDSNNSIVLCD